MFLRYIFDAPLILHILAYIDDEKHYHSRYSLIIVNLKLSKNNQSSISYFLYMVSFKRLLK